MYIDPCVLGELRRLWSSLDERYDDRKRMVDIGSRFGVN